ncbi:MAG: flagellar type III secretion system pore protein FliP [Sphaerobacter sp.]|nr:flagellar type III secretion system pore protein FliP [Sphaerobacter sp.]
MTPPRVQPDLRDGTTPQRHPRWRRRAMRASLLAGALVWLPSCTADAQLGNAQLRVDSGTAGGGSINAGLELFFLLTFLALLPTLLMMVTSFTRVIIVLSFARNAIGVPQLPPNQVLLGLALFLTIFIMAPVWQEVNRTALQPYLAGEVTQTEALKRAEAPLREFMLRQTRERDLALFMQLGQQPRPRTPDDVPTWVLVPSFILSELKTAFQMGFVIFIPFLIIDMIVSSALMSMGMIMLPPVIVSLPFKVLLFVMVDGWDLIVRSLVLSFQ